MLHDEDIEFYNPWFSVRSYLKVYFAEDLGTLILVLGVKGLKPRLLLLEISQGIIDPLLGDGELALCSPFMSRLEHLGAT